MASSENKMEIGYICNNLKIQPIGDDGRIDVGGQGFQE